MSIYCGNNRLSDELLTGSVLGTRYQCLKKGIGKGMHMPVDDSRYSPIDNIKIYCGDKALPPNYDRVGTLHECMSKGIGVGMNIKKEKISHEQYEEAENYCISRGITLDNLFVNNRIVLSNGIVFHYRSPTHIVVESIQNPVIKNGHIWRYLFKNITHVSYRGVFGTLYKYFPTSIHIIRI